MGLTVNWELDFWGKFRRGIESADAAYLASIASYDDVLVTLLGDVATTYIGIRTLETQIKIAEDNVVKQKKAVDDRRAKYRGGTATKLDVYQAENVLGANRVGDPAADDPVEQGIERAARAARHAAAAARRPCWTDRPASRFRHGMSSSASRPIWSAAGRTSARPNWRRRRRARRSASPRRIYTRRSACPALSARSASTISGNKLSAVFQGKGITFGFGPSFQWNILNYGQITNTVRVQDAKLQGLLVDYQNTVLKAQKEVEDGLASFLQGREQVEYLRRSVAAANAALGLAILQWNLGTRDFTTVLTAEQNLYTAQNNLAMAEGGVSTGLTSVYRALGGGWQIRADNEFVPAATAEEMRNRTNWGELLPPPGTPQPPAPGLPTPADVSPNPRLPQW